MKRNLYVLVFLMILTCAITELSLAEDKMPNMIGLGAMVRQEPYKGMDEDIVLMPIITWEKDRFFIKGVKAGYSLFKSDNIKINSIIKPRFMGYDSSDSSYLNGMKDRDFSLDGGGEIIYKFNDFYDISLGASFVADMLSKHEGYEGSVSLSKMFNMRPLFIQPSLSVSWLSENITDYYYGVRQEEVVAGRPAYSPDSSVKGAFSLGAYYALSKQWMIVARGGVELFDNEVKNSPLIEDNYSLSGSIGIAMMF
jgi:MipA family protein